MTSYRSSLMRLLDERGYIHQVTDSAAFDALAAKDIVSAYVGYDATAPSLHCRSASTAIVAPTVHQVKLSSIRI